MSGHDPAVPAQLLLPTYQNRLRVIGRHLDLGGYRSINVMEIPGGFLVRAIGLDGRAPEALEFPDDQFSHLIAQAVAARGEGEHRRLRHDLLPTGYEDFLRSLGFPLDAQGSEALTVAELDGLVAVGGLARVERAERTDIVPFQRLLRADDINALLDAGFRRRDPGSQPAMPVARSMRQKIREISTGRTTFEAAGGLRLGYGR